VSVEIRNDRFRRVVGDGVELERLGTDFGFTEGPVWHGIEKHLTFSDMPGDHMRRWTADGKFVTFRKPSNMANGNAYDRTGRLVTCEHATNRVTRTEHDGSISVLASHYGGKELNSPNDIVVKSDGAIYFSDPTYGRAEFYGVPRPQDLDFQGLYRLAKDGEAPILLADDFAQPNGLCFNRDESLLFVNDTDRGHIRVFQVNPDGTVSGGDVWADVVGYGDGAPDGLKIDENENVYCCGPGGVHVFAPDSTCLGVIRIPEVVANFTWGDDDMKSIFITASTSLYRVRSQTPGPVLF
jgi:gluconolactonase